MLEVTHESKDLLDEDWEIAESQRWDALTRDQRRAEMEAQIAFLEQALELSRQALAEQFPETTA